MTPTGVIFLRAGRSPIATPQVSRPVKLRAFFDVVGCPWTPALPARGAPEIVSDAACARRATCLTPFKI